MGYAIPRPITFNALKQYCYNSWLWLGARLQLTDMAWLVLGLELELGFTVR